MINKKNPEIVAKNLIEITVEHIILSNRLQITTKHLLSHPIKSIIFATLEWPHPFCSTKQ